MLLDHDDLVTFLEAERRAEQEPSDSIEKVEAQKLFKPLRAQSVFLFIVYFFESHPKVEALEFCFLGITKRLYAYANSNLATGDGVSNIECLGKTGPWDVEDYINRHRDHCAALVKFFEKSPPTPGTIEDLAAQWLGPLWAQARQRRMAENAAQKSHGHLTETLPSTQVRPRSRM